MNETVNKHLLAENKYMPEMDLKQLVFAYSAWVQLLKTKKELKNLSRQEIQIISTKELVFNMVWAMVNIKIWIKENR